MELIIVPYYWMFLRQDDSCIVDGIVRHDFPIQCLPSILDHSLPLAVLLADFLFNSQPLIRRHAYIVMALSFVYTAVNFLATKLGDGPVYPTMDWSSLAGILTPIILIFIAGILFLLLDLIVAIKLKITGHHRIVQISRGHKAV
jgi:hypothetical protein